MSLDYSLKLILKTFIRRKVAEKRTQSNCFWLYFKASGSSWDIYTPSPSCQSVGSLQNRCISLQILILGCGGLDSDN